MYELRIPKERIAVLIGKDGETKKQLEQDMHAHLDIDSEEGFVRITGDDSLSLYTAREVIKAIARGFNPELARLLMRGDYVFALIDVTDFASKSKKSFERLRGRIIGSEGKSRKAIEQMTETYLSVYGKTVGIIGESENVEIARVAVENLLEGSPHSSVYRWLEKKGKELARKRTLGTISSE